LEYQFYQVFNENGEDCTNVEISEQQLAKEYIQPDDVVFELGARYGSVSCCINKKLKKLF
jgi:precorrin-6B methylase 2